MDELISEITPKGRGREKTLIHSPAAMVPESVKAELLTCIRAFMATAE